MPPHKNTMLKKPRPQGSGQTDDQIEASKARDPQPKLTNAQKKAFRVAKGGGMGSKRPNVSISNPYGSYMSTSDPNKSPYTRRADREYQERAAAYEKALASDEKTGGTKARDAYSREEKVKKALWEEANFKD